MSLRRLVRALALVVAVSALPLPSEASEGDLIVFWGGGAERRPDRTAVQIAGREVPEAEASLVIGLDEALAGQPEWWLTGGGALRSCEGQTAPRLADLIEQSREMWQNFEHQKARVSLDRAVATLECQRDIDRDQVTDLFFERAVIYLILGEELAARASFLQVFALDPQYSWPSSQPPRYRELFETVRSSLPGVDRSRIQLAMEGVEVRGLTLDGRTLSVREQEDLRVTPGVHLLVAEGGEQRLMVVPPEEVVLSSGDGRRALLMRAYSVADEQLQEVQRASLRRIAEQNGVRYVHLVQLPQDGDRGRGVRFDTVTGEYIDRWGGSFQ